MASMSAQHAPTQESTAPHQRQGVPISLTIVNESTPLIPSRGHSRANATKAGPTATHARPQIRVLSLSTDPAERKKELLGLLLLTLSALSFTVSSLFIKLNVTLPSSEIVFGRSVIQFVFAAVVCAALRLNPLGSQPEVRKWIVMRAFAGAIGLSLFCYSLTKLTLVEATVLFFLGPAFTAILATILLYDSFSLLDGFHAALCLFGVILVIQPRHIFKEPQNRYAKDPASDLDRYFAIACAIAGAVMSAIAYAAVRKTGKRTHFIVHSFYFGLISAITSMVTLFAFESHIEFYPDTKACLQVVLVGVFAVIGQCLLNQGIRMAPPGLGTVTRMNDVFFAIILGMAFLDEHPDMYTILGSALVVSMTTALGIKRWYERASHSSNTRESSENTSISTQ